MRNFSISTEIAKKRANSNNLFCCADTETDCFAALEMAKEKDEEFTEDLDKIMMAVKTCEISGERTGVPTHFFRAIIATIKEIQIKYNNKRE